MKVCFAKNHSFLYFFIFIHLPYLQAQALLITSLHNWAKPLDSHPSRAFSETLNYTSQLLHERGMVPPLPSAQARLLDPNEWRKNIRLFPIFESLEVCKICYYCLLQKFGLKWCCRFFLLAKKRSDSYSLKSNIHQLVLFL